MNRIQLALAAGLCALSAGTHAAVTSTWTLASDYDLRGITQTAHGSTIQASVDYQHASGAYLGGWSSNVDFCASDNRSCLDADYEIDLYTGFTGTTEAGLGWDVGVIRYTYEAAEYDYQEIYAGLSKHGFKTKVSYSNDFGGSTTSGNTPAFYVEASAAAPLPADFTVQAHIGYSGGSYWKRLDRVGAGRQYVDYSLGVGYAIGKVHLTLKWVDGSDLRESNDTPGGYFSSKARAVLSVSTTFPRQ